MNSMVCEAKTWYTISIIFVLLIMKHQHVSGEPQVPCYFIFGDSLVDNGNNNVRFTSAKANYPPYGIDFRDGRPTGRFTNGRNSADFIAELLGFGNYIPPFSTAKDEKIIRGVNYGSGGAGILDETGKQHGDVISLNMQLLYHRTTVSRMALLLGSNSSAQEHLSKCFYHVEIGSNDYINNYLLPQYYPTSRLYSPDQYATLLIKRYEDHLKTLYKLGARKVAIFSLGAVGSTPGLRDKMDYANNAIQLFNQRLKPLVDDLNMNLSNAKFIYLNTSSISSSNLPTTGTRLVVDPCCKISTSLMGACIPGEVPCNNRTEYLFWDNYHPTEIVVMVSASKAYKAQSPTDAYPIDISRLVQL